MKRRINVTFEFETIENDSPSTGIHLYLGLAGLEGALSNGILGYNNLKRLKAAGLVSVTIEDNTWAETGVSLQSVMDYGDNK